MGTCDHPNPTLDTQNHFVGSSNLSHFDVCAQDVDNHHLQLQNLHKDQTLDAENLDKDQTFEEKPSTIVEKLESLELQNIGDESYVEEEGYQEEKDEEEEEEEEEKEKVDGISCDYPLRPEAMDCSFFLKTGTCKFGLNCRFNHPPEKVARDKEKGFEEGDGLGADTGKIECKYFSTPGGCKYGNACKYNHVKDNMEMKSAELNFLGLPIRPLEKECIFYMRNGTCGYGANCRFNHPDPTATKEFDGMALSNGSPLTGGNSALKPYEQLHSPGVLQATLPKQSNGINLRHTLPYTASINPYHHGILQDPGWNQNQVSMPFSTNIPAVPHQAVKNFSKTTYSPTHYENSMQIEEFPERPGQPDCDYFMKTGDCKYKSACRYNHPSGRASKRLPPLSVKNPYSNSATRLPAETAEFLRSNSNNTRNNGEPFGNHHQQMQIGEFPERPGQPECEYFMKTGNCKFRAACRYHHPRKQASAASPSALNEKGFPLRPGSRICRNYEQQGTCKYGRNCLFHHPDDISSSVEVAPVVMSQDHSSSNVDVDVNVNVTIDSEIPASSVNKDGSDWEDGWVM